MGIGGKVVKGTIIGVAGVTAVAGIAVYNAGKYVRKLIYPPTMKKYVALATIPFVLYAVKKPIESVEAVSSAVSYSGKAIAKSVSGIYENKLVQLGRENDDLIRENSELEEKLLNSKKEENSALLEKNIALDNLDVFAKKYWTALAIDASANSVSLLTSENGKYIEMKKFKCTTGSNPLPKNKIGDLATPRGIFISYMNSNPGWNNNFTDDFLRLDLPSDLGKGILITGTTNLHLLNSIKWGRDSTNGGIVLSKDDFKEIAQRIHVGQKVPVAVYFSGRGLLPNYAY